MASSWTWGTPTSPTIFNSEFAALSGNSFRSENIPEELKRQLSPPEWFDYLPFDMTGLWMGKGHTRANLHYGEGVEPLTW